MLLAGKNIQSSSDQMVKVTEEYVYHAIQKPKPELASKIRQLRIVRDLDRKNYSIVKRQLPYLVCGIFSPPLRKTENFAYIERFIIDIDHLSDKGLDIVSLRKKLMADSRVMLLFTSPGEDGLKVLMRLSDRCYDAGVYSLFYKEFVKSFSFEYGLDQVVDCCTSDVTRACFMSVDPDVYYNPDAEGVALSDYLPLTNPQAMFDIKSNQSITEKKNLAAKKKEQEPKLDSDPDSETMESIKLMLQNKKQKATVQKNDVYVPEQLNEILHGLTQFVEDQGITLYETVNIQYAKKLRFKLGLKLAEINLFYGKRGFNVVQSPRSGTSAELNAMVAEIIQIYLSENT